MVPISEAYIKTYQQGWKGLMVWTSNGVDGNGSLADCGVGLTAFQNQYPELVSPDSATSEAYIISDPEITIWPNPASDYIYFNRSSELVIMAKIFDLYGRMVYTSVVQPKDYPALNIQSCQPGAYVIMLSSGCELNMINLLVQ